MKITFRTDASIHIGTGHVIRCLTLAETLRKRGCECHFISREHEGNLIDFIRKNEFEVNVLSKLNNKRFKSDSDNLAHSKWLGTSQADDANQTINILRKEQTDWIIVDHYALDEEWESALLPYTKKILVIDDIADRKHVCNILLDQNLGKRYDNYKDLVLDKTALLLGPKYALLQPQYAEMHPSVQKRKGSVKNILVYFGGSDVHDLTLLSTQAFIKLKRPDIEINIVIGNSYQNKDELAQLLQNQNNINLHQNLPSLAVLMVQADFAIGAGGATSWERCCLGLPSMVVALADNQIPVARALERNKLAIWLGQAKDISVERLIEELRLVLDTQFDLSGFSERCLSVTNGMGASIVSAYMVLNNETPVNVRLATINDEKLLLEWANDALVRRNSFNSEHITPEQHQQWFHSKLQQPDTCKIYILETDEQLPIGQVRFEWDGQSWLINYALAPAARGNGLGEKIIATAINSLNQVTGKKIIHGKVKKTNQASIRIFQALNFIEQDLENYLLFIKG